jgi:hypothetical protein
MLGSVFMIAADAQKYYTLRVKRGLITDGMHRYVRHPNYLGEMMIYGSFAMMVWHWLPVVVLAWVWLRAVRGEHGAQGSQHVALPRVGRLQAAQLVADSLRALTQARLGHRPAVHAVRAADAPWRRHQRRPERSLNPWCPVFFSREHPDQS